jgi:hypothetical protein
MTELLQAAGRLAGIPVIADVTPPRQRPAPSRARLLARLALAGVAAYVTIDVLLAFLRPGYSHRRRPVPDCPPRRPRPQRSGPARHLGSDPAWRRSAAVLLAISIAGALAYLLLGAPHKHYHAPVGLYERIFLGLELLWMVIAAIAIARRTPATQPE